MNDKRHRDKQRELAQLRADAAQIDRRIQQLEAELAHRPGQPDWRDQNQYWTYYATTGFFLGMAGAIASLLFNIIGSLAVGQHPLKLIQVYLTFGLGERALQGEQDNNLTLLVGCCLYIATGMLYGIPFQMVMSRLPSAGSLPARMIVASVLGLFLWVVNFYFILTWLQPLLFGGRWIVDEIPWFVSASTHLVFAWTMALLYPWGAFIPYRLSTEPQ